MATDKLNLDKLKLLQTRTNCEVAGACVREPFNLPAGCPPVPKPVITVVDTCKLPDLVATKNIISSAVLLTPDIGFSVDTYCVDVKTKITGPGAGSLSWRVSPEAGDCTVGQYELDLSLECPLSPSEIATHGLLTGGITISNCSISGDLCVPEIDINMDCNCKKLITINKRDVVDQPGSDDSGCGLKEYGFDVEVNIPCPVLDITRTGKSFVKIKQGDLSNGKSLCESGKCEYNWEIEVDCPGGRPGLSLGGDIQGDFTMGDDCALNLSLCVPEYTFKTDVNYFCSIDDKDPEEPEDSNDSEDFDYSTTQQPRFTIETTELTPRNGTDCGAKEITFELDIPKPPEIEIEATLKGGCPESGAEVAVTEKEPELNACKKTYSIDITLPTPPSISISGSGIAKVTSTGTECEPSFTIDVPEPCIPEYIFEPSVNYVCSIDNKDPQPKFTIATTELTSRDGSDCKDKKVTFELDIPKPPELELAFNVVGGCPNTEAKVIPSVSPDGCTKTATLQLTLPKPPEFTINSGKGISVNGGGSPCGGYAYTISLTDDDDDGAEPCIPVFEAEEEECDCENSDKKGKKINFTIQSCDCTGSNDEKVLCEPETLEGACVCELPKPCTPEITGDNVDCYCGDKSGKQTKITITGCCEDKSGVLKPCEKSSEITGPCVCEQDTDDTEDDIKFDVIESECYCEGDSNDENAIKGTQTSLKITYPDGSSETKELTSCVCEPETPRFRTIAPDCECNCGEHKGTQQIFQIAPNGCPDDVSEECGWEDLYVGPCEGCPQPKQDYRMVEEGCTCEGGGSGTQYQLQTCIKCSSEQQCSETDWADVGDPTPCKCNDDVCAIDNIYVTQTNCDDDDIEKTVTIGWSSTNCPTLYGSEYFTIPCSGGGEDDSGGGGGEDPGDGGENGFCDRVGECLDELDENDERKICGMIANCSIIDSLSNAIDDLEARLDDMDASIAAVFQDINAQLDGFNQSIGDLYRRMDACCPENNN